MLRVRGAPAAPPLARAQPRLLDTALLHTFVTVCELGSITRTAEAVGVTQAAVSQQIRRIEDLARCVLLSRGARRVVPTEEGLVLLEFARKILELNGEAMTRLAGLTLTGSVRLGIVEDTSDYGLATALREFHTAHEAVRIELVMDRSPALLQLLDAGRLDIAIAKSAPDNRDALVLVREPLVWVTCAGQDPEPDQPVPLICSPPPCVNRAAMVEALEEAGRRYSVVCSSVMQGGIHLGVRSGLGVSAMPVGTVRPWMRVIGPGTLPPLPTRDLRLYRAQRRDAPATEALIDHLRQRIAPRAAPDAAAPLIPPPRTSRHSAPPATRRGDR
jgi:DNA-binding transcriptional LysR family regulator